MNERYDHIAAAARWGRKWEEDGLDEFQPHTDKPKFYWLTMLPYPSGDLHIGHWYAMAPSDAGARFKRMNGYNVFFPIGFDAFGLPAENAAIMNNIHPRIWTYQNIERMRGQLRSMGAMWAWKNEVISCEPDYYKWSQWAFLKFYEMGLAYREFAPVDFCPSCNTTLAREQVVGEERLCERCHTPVVKKDLNQWKYRITRYAEALLEFSETEWPEAVRTMQTNWIGRSEGVEFDMAIQGREGKSMRVFTTRPDTIFGISFCVLSPEHPLVSEITSADRREAVDAYRLKAEGLTEIERMADTGEKDGVFTGGHALNPISGEPVPIWIADYVLMGYGTGAIMAVPAHDTRDFAFAKRYELPIPPVIRPADGAPGEGMEEGEAYTGKEGSIMCNCPPEFDGLPWPEGCEKVAAWLEERGVGEKTVNYRLRDWLISRQRMWGTPIPMIHCPACGTVPVPYEELPVVLPDDAVFKPTGESPLNDHAGFLNVDCPQCGGAAKRETDTMDTFICSNWYMYAYLSPYWKAGETITADDRPWDAAIMAEWVPVDQYTGGIEHAILHLLYLRFYAHGLYDAGIMPTREPIKRLFNQGMILGEDNEKMSKSRGNVINPDDLVERYGADTMRTYLMFIGPWDQGGPWSSSGIEGAHRFINDIWHLATAPGEKVDSPDEEQSRALTRQVHATLKKAGEDYGAFKYNTCIAALMTLRNRMKASRKALLGSPAWEETLDKVILMLAPIAPYFCEELWQMRHPGPSVHLQPWPVYDPALTEAEAVTLVIQINGKIRDRLEIPAQTEPEELEALALNQPKVVEALKNKTVRKVIPVGNKLVNIVAA